jgi:transposase-like protein
MLVMKPDLLVEKVLPLDPQHIFCPNVGCPNRGLTGRGNIGIKSQKERRYVCKTCGRTFAATTGTVYYRAHTPAWLLTAILALLAWGCPPQAIVAAFGFDERTVAAWALKAGAHCQQVQAHLVEAGQVVARVVQADELWVKLVGRKVWQARVAVQGLRKSALCDTKERAKDKAAELRCELQARAAQAEEQAQQPATLRQLLEFYALDMQAHGKGEESVGRVAYTRKVIEDLMPQLLDTPVSAIGDADLFDFRTRRRREGTKPSTINRRLAAVEALYVFLMPEDDELVCPVFPRRHHLREPQRLPRPVQESELSILARKCTSDSRQPCSSDSRQRCTTFSMDASCKSTGMRGMLKGSLSSYSLPLAGFYGPSSEN